MIGTYCVENGRKLQLFVKNAWTFMRIVRASMLDDPTYFFVQIARRFESQSVAKIANVCIQSLPKRALVITAFSLLLSGDISRLIDYLRHLEPDNLSERALAHLGDIAIAIHDPVSAEHLLVSRSAESTVLKRTQARYAWYLGDMQRAIDILRNVVPSSNRQLSHYQSEIDVFQGAMPTVERPVEPQLATSQQFTALHFLTNSLPHTGSGYAQRSHSIMTSLRAEGWNVDVLTRAGYPLSVGMLRAQGQDVVDGITYRRILPWRYESDLASKVQMQADALADFIVRRRPCVLHTTTDFSNALAVMSVAEAFGLPWVYEVRGQLADTWASTRPLNVISSQRYRLFKEREAFVASRATHVLTLGESMRSELVAGGVPVDKISIAPNAIGDSYLDEPIERTEARALLGLSMKHQYVGTVSSLVAYEGLDLLVRAAAGLIPENPDLRLLIVGSGVEANNLKVLSIELGIDEYCIFPGRVRREVARTYHCALDVFVVPRRDLSVTQAVTPLKPVEALACKVPVIASDLPALRELVEHEVTGLLVKPDDVGQLGEAIRTLLENPSKRASMGAAGRRIMLAERTWAANAKKLSATYKLIADKLQ